MVHRKNSFWQLLRMVFVIFSLYLMGDAFYRWDGFSYYASFYEFLPAVGLAFILWSFVSVLAAIFAWLFFRILIVAFRISGLKIKFEHLLSYIVVFVVFGTLVWKGKKIIWPVAQTTLNAKLIVFLSVAFLSLLVAWFFRNRAEKTIAIIQERITPLVWLFGFIVISSIPLVAYNTWWKTDKIELKDSKSLASVNNLPNIILVTFDGLAARNMSVYGYERETTPFIRRWSNNAAVFTNVEAASNFTTPAAASLMTGKRVWTHQTYQIEGTRPIRSSVESLPALLKDNGYFNIALVVNPFASVKVLGMSNSFDIAPSATEFSEPLSLFGWKFGIIDVILYRTFGDKIRLHNWILSNEFIFSKFLNLISRNVIQTEVPPEKAFNNLLGIMDNNIPKPFFVWIHLFPPHDPYLPPEPFKGSFNTSSELRSYKRQEALIEESYKYLFQYRRYPEEMQPAVNLMRDYYDESITYIDRQFEDFIEKLNKMNMENTVIILSSDHGESFQHGYLTHGGPFLYEQVTHVPLIIKETGQTTGKVVSDLVEQIDIPATILDLANIPEHPWMEGRSLLPLLRGEKLPQRHAFSMNFEENPSRGHQITRGSIAVWEGDHKLIYYLKKNEYLLFNLRRDPDELDNLVEKEPKIKNRLRNLIKTDLENANDRIRLTH